MISTRPWLAAAVAMLLPALAWAQATTRFSLPPLHFELQGEWRIESSKAPIEGLGPNREEMLVSPVRRRIGSSSPPVTEVAKGFAASRMSQEAERAGTIVRQVQSFPMPTGKVGFSAASERMTRVGKVYFVQYILAEEDVGFYVTFEGDGDANSAIERFDRAMGSQRWGNER